MQQTPKTILLPEVERIEDETMRDVLTQFANLMEENHRYYYEDLRTKIITLVDGDTSPDVSSGTVFKTNNTGSTTITTFDKGFVGQKITIIFGDANTTIATTDNIILDTAFTSAVDDVLQLVYDGTSWRERARSAIPDIPDEVDLSTEVDDFTIKYENDQLKIADRIEQNIMLNAFRIAINGSLVKYNMVNAIMDEFEDESGVDTGSSSNEDYDSSNDLYSPTSTETADQSQTDSTDDGYLGDDNGDENRLAQSFQLSDTLTVSAVEIREGSTRYGSPSGNWTLRIETDSGGLPSGSLANANATIEVSPPGVDTIIKGTFGTSFQLTGSTTYWIVIQCDNQANNTAWSISKKSANVYASGQLAYSTDGGSSWTSVSTQDLYFKVYVAEINDMTLISESTTAESQPDNAILVLYEEDVDSVTENTDLKGYVSRDGGTTYSQVTLSDEGDYASGKRILTGLVDISGQPVGTSMIWKATTHNDKNLKLHGVGVVWG